MENFQTFKAKIQMEYIKVETNSNEKKYLWFTSQRIKLLICKTKTDQRKNPKNSIEKIGNRYEQAFCRKGNTNGS